MESFTVIKNPTSININTRRELCRSSWIVHASRRAWVSMQVRNSKNDRLTVQEGFKKLLWNLLDFGVAVVNVHYFSERRTQSTHSCAMRIFGDVQGNLLRLWWGIDGTAYFHHWPPWELSSGTVDHINIAFVIYRDIYKWQIASESCLWSYRLVQRTTD